MVARIGRRRPTNRRSCKKARLPRSKSEGKSSRGEAMKILRATNRTASRWVIATAAMSLAGATAFVPGYQAGRKSDPQEKEAKPSGNDATTTLNDQTDLAVTVYNSNIALIRDVRQLQLPGGNFRLKFED